jgi:hypothetical protein
MIIEQKESSGYKCNIKTVKLADIFPVPPILIFEQFYNFNIQRLAYLS